MSYPQPVHGVERLSALSRRERKAVLGGNAARLMKL
jgi:hypothetical protein